MSADEAAVLAVAIESVGGADQWAFLGIDLRALYLNRARMILATTVVADALGSAETLAKVRAIVAEIDNEPPSGTAGVTSNARLFLRIADLLAGES